ncbi:hypothetical protein IV203_003951 [Nitzschia inconspicua]|uniref:Uncharacterized protein n=1 Tax=Nitzschia inconspicua TaxID=303405 RepID=A0A9K3PNX2_9STRA|nr:hypothetical protein IV203_003951 [Nitzschia inconspicua]
MVVYSEGSNRCVIGHVPEKLSEYFHRLEGRIAQVYTIYLLSKDSNRMAFSNKNDGFLFPSSVCEKRATKPVAPQPGDYSYSGMHDQGPLPDLKQGGPMALLLGCVEGAKEYNNSFLTTLIEEEKEQTIKLTKSDNVLQNTFDFLR